MYILSYSNEMSYFSRLKQLSMDMRIFQVKANKALPVMGSILIASPLLSDYQFTRTVILMVTNNEEGSMGIVMNKRFSYRVTLGQLVPGLESIPVIPVFKGGPVGRDTIFFLHTIRSLKDSLEISDGLYLNGDFNELKKYLLEGNPVEGHIRFFSGYAGWENGQLEREIKENSWMIGYSDAQHLLADRYQRNLWSNSLCDLGQPYKLWSKYPVYPSFN